VKKYRIIVAGGRDFRDRKLCFESLDHLTANFGKGQIEVVCGMARGADTLGRLWAETKGIPVTKFPVEWEKYGRRAGYIRNDQMAEYATHLIAFWDGVSRGTRHMIETARSSGLVVDVVEY